MSNPPQPPVVIKFPPRPQTEKPLVLPRRPLRDPFVVAETTAETQKAIEAIRTATRNPWSDSDPSIGSSHLQDLEKSLKQLAVKLEERERFLQDLEARLTDRDRNLAEMETLLKARESLVDAAKSKKPGDESQALSREEMQALEKLKAEVERQQVLLQQQREELRAREAFLDESEAKLFEKVQQQQEKETELEQREDDLRARERRLKEKEALNDPKLAAALKAEAEAAKKRKSEFYE
jgi:chromosome segregation ATPase